MLAQLTLGWSFLEGVGLEALSKRSPEDVAAAMAAVERRAVPLTDARSSKELAEGLFEGLVAGTDTGGVRGRAPDGVYGVVP